MSTLTKECTTAESNGVVVVDTIKSKLRETPWAMVFAVASGLAGFIVCRKLFKQPRPAALIQGYAVAASTFGAINAEPKKQPLH